MFTVPLVFKALMLLGLGVALAIPCFARTCGDPIVRLRESASNLKLYWGGLAAGLFLVASGLAVSVAAANEISSAKACAKPATAAQAPATQPASYSGG